MTLQIECALICDQCKAVAPVDARTLRTAEIRKLLKLYIKRLEQQAVDLCPDCVGKLGGL